MSKDIRIKAIVRKIEYFDSVVFVWELDNDSDAPSYAIVEMPDKEHS